MKKTKTKILALGLATVLSFGMLTGCGNGDIGQSGSGGSGNGSSGGTAATKVTEITFRQWGGTASNSDWLKNAIKRFTDLKAEESYEEGKKGVKITTATNKANDYNSSLPDYDILLDENVANAYNMQTRGLVADISDVVAKLESKIEPQLLPKLKGADGKYYALPHYSYDVGISYNIDVFEESKLYIAAPGETAVREYTSALAANPVNFVASAGTKKSCGPDGVYNTYDDGLPSSLEEYIVLCDYIKTQKNMNPFALNTIDEGAGYAFMLIEAIWSGLVGTDAMKATTCNFTDAEVEVVKDGTLSLGADFLKTGIKVPETETIVINDENGYKMYDMSARYYALSFLELAKNQGWFKNENMSNVKAQEYFVLGEYNIDSNDRCAMLVDSSYWYGEAVAAGTIKTYTNASGGEEPRVSIMPMPTQLTGQVTENNGKKPTIIDTTSTLFVNKRVEKNPGQFRAVKEFIEFLYSDAELKAFTETSKLAINMDYDYDENALGEFYKGVLAIEKAAGDKVYTASDNAKYLKNRDTFSLIWGGKLNYFGKYHNGSYAALKDGMTATQIFETTRRTLADWQSLA